MDLYNEIQQWGSFSEDLLPPPQCSPLAGDHCSPFKPSSSWLDPSLDDLLEVKLDLSFLEVGCAMDWAINDPEMVKPSLPSPVAPPVPPLDSSFYFPDDPIADLFGQLDSPSLLKLDTPPQSPGLFQPDSAGSTPSLADLPPSPPAMPPLLELPSEAHSSPLELAAEVPLSPMSQSSTSSPPATPPIPRVSSSKPPKNQQKRKTGRRQGATRVERKRVQNKEAATRYRIKKRAESEALCDEMDELEQRNAHLKEKASDLTREIGYLKGLLKEFRERATATATR